MPASTPPNILYIHSHDTGRYVQPYGYQVPTPNIQLLADQGVLFRKAFCAAPTCSGSRASLLTGQYCHNNGMLGLAHRGWSLNDYGEHLIHPLRSAGYRSVLIGEQHISEDPAVIGYDEVIEVDSHHAADVAPITAEALATASEPFFFSVATPSTRSRPRISPTPGTLAATWRRSRPAPARSTRASAPCSTRCMTSS
jgi:N-sulfoglucosamine sulfohydrolase